MFSNIVLMSYRGTNTLFSHLFNEPVQTISTPKKGRNTSLNEKRNEFLLSRYYYYCTFFNKKLSYNFIIETIAEENYLSPVTIPEIIDDYFHILNKIKGEKPTLIDLRKRYPHIVWEPKLVMLKNLPS
jgi:hypothetical protein